MKTKSEISDLSPLSVPNLEICAKLSTLMSLGLPSLE